MGRIKAPTETPEPDVPQIQLTRMYPSYDTLGAKTLSGPLETLVRGLMDFEETAPVPHLAVQYIVKLVSSSRTKFNQVELLSRPEQAKRKRNYFFLDPWDQRSMVIVRESARPITDGFHTLVAHADSPCLQVKPVPIRREWDPDEQPWYLGVRLAARAYGGINIHQWTGRSVRILGYTRGYFEGKKKINDALRTFDFPGWVGDFAAHVDDRADDALKQAFPHEKMLEIIPGDRDPASLIKRMHFRNLDQFASSRLWAVSQESPKPLTDYDWRLLAGPGHDDKSCLYSAVDAIIKARNPEYTSIVWVTDHEEVGDSAPTGARGPFLERVLEFIIEKQRAEKRISNRQMTAHSTGQMYLKSCVIIADVGLAPFGPDKDLMDSYSAPKIGSGVFIDSSDGEGKSVPTGFIRKLEGLTNGGRGKPICHQMSGSSYQGEDAFLSEDPFVRGYLIPKGVQWAYAGIPLGAMHSPSEILCSGDLLCARDFYVRFLQSNITLD